MPTAFLATGSPKHDPFRQHASTNAETPAQTKTRDSRKDFQVGVFSQQTDPFPRWHSSRKNLDFRLFHKSNGVTSYPASRFVWVRTSPVESSPSSLFQVMTLSGQNPLWKSTLWGTGTRNGKCWRFSSKRSCKRFSSTPASNNCLTSFPKQWTILLLILVWHRSCIQENPHSFNRIPWWTASPGLVKASELFTAPGMNKISRRPESV